MHKVHNVRVVDVTDGAVRKVTSTTVDHLVMIGSIAIVRVALICLGLIALAAVFV